MEFFTAIGLLFSAFILAVGIAFGVMYTLDRVKDFIEFRNLIKRELGYQINSFNRLSAKVEMCEANIQKLEDRVTMLRGKDG